MFTILNSRNLLPTGENSFLALRLGPIDTWVTVVTTEEHERAVVSILATQLRTHLLCALCDLVGRNELPHILKGNKEKETALPH